ncbi:MAG TPA: FGGY family carbohydrate kinase [Vicinamibacterales bacterium]|nr:FGGY family carbohydrate kinase [Vicinamibacterales bacterium]
MGTTLNPPMLYLGLDCSTQSLTAIVIEVDDDARAVVYERSLDFDVDLPHYGTRHGVLPADDPRVAVSPPIMWAEALDRVLADVAASGLDLSRLAAIAGSAQQHGSVYLNASAGARLATLDPAQPLAPQLEGLFSRPVAPIWMDVSADEECREITRAMGGADRLATLTGSRAFERFTGPQIRKFFKREPDRYAATDRIHMVSSFMASLLTGGHAPLDPGDASGMNLMDLLTNRWLPDALEATAPDLGRRLPPIVSSWSVVGTVASYWQGRHGLPPARVVAWSGDNSCSLIGTGLVRPGQLTVSLGTSDTVCGVMARPDVDRSGIGHVFGAPTGEFLALVCFRNGSLARERVRDQFGLDWDAFSAALRSTPAGNHGGLMLPWFEPEITPDVPVAGVHVVDLDPADGAASVRAVVEGQMLGMFRHSRWMGVETQVIHATGGATVNREILQVMADVFDAEVRQFIVANAACLGAALRALHADREADGRPMAWTDVVKGLAEPVAGSAVEPVAANGGTYRELAAKQAELERRVRSAGSGT